MARKDVALLTAMAASLALALTVLLVPLAPWRAPLALLAGIWAPGYALLALCYRGGRLVALERHALAVGAGILLLPLLALAVSATVGFRGATLAGAQALLTLLAGGVALARGGEPEPLARSPDPSWRAVAAVGVVAAIALVGALTPTLVAREPAPRSLALEGSQVVARAGDEPASGVLLVTLDGAVLGEHQVDLAPGEESRMALPPGLEGQLSARWAGREVHARLDPEVAA